MVMNGGVQFVEFVVQFQDVVVLYQVQCSRVAAFLTIVSIITIITTISIVSVSIVNILTLNSVDKLLT